MELKNASCIVTGAARGLGAALSRDLAGRGARIILSDIMGPELEEMGRELGMPAVHCDITNREEVERLGRLAVDTYGRIDVWINNAGIWMPYTPAENIDFNASHRLMEVNYFGTAYGMLEALRHMQGQGSGYIVNILSVRGLEGKALAASYCASKFAAEGFTQSLREEFSDSGIRFIGVYPHRIKTGLFGENRHEDYAQSMEPADVARIIGDSLAAEASEYIEIVTPDDVRTVPGV